MNKEKLNKMTKSLLLFLKENLNNGGYTTRTYYGELYTALAMVKYDKEYFKREISEIIKYYFEEIDKTDNQFHWEFNNYAILELSKEIDITKYNNEIFPLKFKGTKSSNWVFLRSLCRINSKENLKLGHYEALKTSMKFQKESGFIKDSPYDNSFQYHCFMTYLLLKIYKESGKAFYLKKFLSSLNFIEKFILDNGDFHYIGRGQKQIFGVGPLLYSLEEGYKITGDKKYKYKQKLVFEHLEKYQRIDGSFPLVLREEEKGFPRIVDVNDANFLGWYGYNNYFDYLPFLAYFLSILGRDYQELNSTISHACNKEEQYYDNDFFLFRNDNYEAVLSKPEGSLVNDLPIPYICSGKKVISSCYGGEGFGSNLYSVEGTPLPWGILDDRKNSSGMKDALYKLLYINKRNIFSQFKPVVKSIVKFNRNQNGKYYFRENLIYCLKGNILIGQGYRMKHVRKLNFFSNSILVEEEITFRKKTYFKEFYPIHLLFKNLKRINNSTFYSEEGLIIEVLDIQSPLFINEQKYYCAIGELDNLRYTLNDITFEKGDKVAFKYNLQISECDVM
jgi:hypothetical protein